MDWKEKKNVRRRKGGRARRTQVDVKERGWEKRENFPRNFRKREIRPGRGEAWGENYV